MSIRVRRTALAKRPFGRRELKAGFADKSPEAEIWFKLYRQATNKIVGVSEAAAAFSAAELLV